MGTISIKHARGDAVDTCPPPARRDRSPSQTTIRDPSLRTRSASTPPPTACAPCATDGDIRRDDRLLTMDACAIMTGAHWLYLSVTTPVHHQQASRRWRAAQQYAAIEAQQRALSRIRPMTLSVAHPMPRAHGACARAASISAPRIRKSASRSESQGQKCRETRSGCERRSPAVPITAAGYAGFRATQIARCGRPFPLLCGPTRPRLIAADSRTHHTARGGMQARRRSTTRK